MKLQSNENIGRPTDKVDLYPLIKYLIEEEGLSPPRASRPQIFTITHRRCQRIIFFSTHRDLKTKKRTWNHPPNILPTTSTTSKQSHQRDNAIPSSHPPKTRLVDIGKRLR